MTEWKVGSLRKERFRSGFVHFSLFDRAEIRTVAKKNGGGGGESQSAR